MTAHENHLSQSDEGGFLIERVRDVVHAVGDAPFEAMVVVASVGAVVTGLLVNPEREDY